MKLRNKTVLNHGRDPAASDGSLRASSLNVETQSLSPAETSTRWRPQSGRCRRCMVSRAMSAIRSRSRRCTAGSWRNSPCWMFWSTTPALCGTWTSNLEPW